MKLYERMYLIPEDEYHSSQETCREHARLIDSIGGDVTGGQVNHIQIGEGGRVTIKPTDVTASNKRRESRGRSPSPPAPPPPPPFNPGPLLTSIGTQTNSEPQKSSKSVQTFTSTTSTGTQNDLIAPRVNLNSIGVQTDMPITSVNSIGTQAEYRPSVRSIGIQGQMRPSMSSQGTQSGMLRPTVSTGTQGEMRPSMSSQGTQSGVLRPTVTTGTQGEMPPTMSSQGTQSEMLRPTVSTGTQGEMRSTLMNQETQSDLSRPLVATSSTGETSQDAQMVDTSMSIPQTPSGVNISSGESSAQNESYNVGKEEKNGKKSATGKKYLNTSSRNRLGPNELGSALKEVMNERLRNILGPRVPMIQFHPSTSSKGKKIVKKDIKPKVFISAPDVEETKILTTRRPPAIRNKPVKVQTVLSPESMMVDVMRRKGRRKIGPSDEKFARYKGKIANSKTARRDFSPRPLVDDVPRRRGMKKRESKDDKGISKNRAIHDIVQERISTLTGRKDKIEPKKPSKPVPREKTKRRAVDLESDDEDYVPTKSRGVIYS